MWRLFAVIVCRGGRLITLSRQHGVAGVTTHGQGSSVAPKGLILGAPLSLVISRHSLVLEQILRSSPSTTASVIFLGFKKKKTNQEALRHVRR